MSASPLPALGSALLLTLAGAGILRLLRPTDRLTPASLGLAFAAGASWLGLVVLAAGTVRPWASGPVLVGLLLAPAAAALVQLWWPGRRHDLVAGGAEQPSPQAGRLSFPPAGWLSFLPALAVAGFSMWLALQRPVWNVDALMRWVLHGQWLHAYDTVLPERVEDPSWSITHPSYPPLVPGAIALALDFGADRFMGLRPLFPFFFLALLGILHGHAWRHAGPRAAPWLTLAFALTPCLAYLPQYAAAAGGAQQLPPAAGLGSDEAMADVPLALLLTAAAVTFLDLCAAPARGTALLCALLAAGAVLAKQEGTAYAPAMLAVGVAAGALRGGPGRRLRVACGALVLAASVAAAAAWTALSARMPVMPGEDYLGSAGLAALGDNLDRLPVILGRLGRELATVELWGPLWLVPLLWLAVAVARRRGLDAVSILPVLWLLLALVLIVVAYVVTGWRQGQYEWLMQVSLTRLLLHHAPLCALLAAELAGLLRRAPPTPGPVVSATAS